MPTVKKSQRQGHLESAEQRAQIEHLLDFVLANKMDFTRGFLADQSLANSGSRQVLRGRLSSYLDTGQLTVDQLVQHLNHIEGWGNQHVYLYQAPEILIERWSDSAYVTEKLRSVKLLGLLNKRRPLILPDGLELSEISLTKNSLRVIWVTRRAWEERLGDRDIISEEPGDPVVWKCFGQRVSRGLISFEMNLVNGDTTLMIQRLPSGSNYNSLREFFCDQLNRIIDTGLLTIVRVGTAIRSVSESGEARHRQLALETPRGGRARFTSSNQAEDAFAEPSLLRAKEALGNVRGYLGNFYWTPSADLESEFHVVVYATDHRVGLFGQRKESEVRHVLGRIRAFAV